MSVVNLYLLNVNEKAKLARKKYKEKIKEVKAMVRVNISRYKNGD